MIPLSRVRLSVNVGRAPGGSFFGQEYELAIMAPSKRNGVAVNGGHQTPLIPQSGDEIYDQSNNTGPKLRKTTDRTRWRMRDIGGVHTWQYLEDDEAAKKWPQSIADKWYLGMPTVRTTQLSL